MYIYGNAYYSCGAIWSINTERHVMYKLLMYCSVNGLNR